MLKRHKIAIVLITILALLAWAPWITDQSAMDRVVQLLGGPDAQFTYLGESMAVKDIPKRVQWFPFLKYVTFPSEAGWFVTFWGAIY